ncbi:MAG: hypothetical protein FD157_3866 [Rhodocyclaceae bacterium]|nr:MAG: hypothetical protein FD157_3866 [Rhodocyclaceae bacterium]TNC99851.1 MAG: hypothetical protein FD118_3591 [Rhodocyclaceae bacterium]
MLQVGLRGVLFEFKGEQLQGRGGRQMSPDTRPTLHFSTLNKEEWIQQ